MFLFITWIIFSLSWSLLHERIAIIIFILRCLEAARTLWVCEVQSKKSIEKYFKSPFALAEIAGSGSSSCEKNRLLQSCLHRVSWSRSSRMIWTQTADLKTEQPWAIAKCAWLVVDPQLRIHHAKGSSFFLFFNSIHFDLCLLVLFVVLQEELVYRRLPINNKNSNCRLTITLLQTIHVFNGFMLSVMWFAR